MNYISFLKLILGENQGVYGFGKNLWTFTVLEIVSGIGGNL